MADNAGDFSLDVLYAAPFGAYAVDQGQIIRFWNSGAEGILGHRGRDVIGRICHQVLQASPSESLPPVCQRGCPFICLAGQKRIAPPLRTRMLCASGQWKRVKLTPLIIPEEDDRITLLHVFYELPDERGAGRTGGAAPSRLSPLTGRERQVLGMMAAGLTNHEIAGNLTLSYHTVRNHVSRIREKLQAGTREQATLIARNLDLI